MAEDRPFPVLPVGAWTLDAFREYIERIVHERDRQYHAEIAAIRREHEADIQSLMQSIAKAEEAQKSYNERSNEFRGQLDDQAKTLMPRSEATLLVAQVDQRVDTMAHRLAALELNAANLQGRFWAVTAIAWLVMLAVSIVLRLLH